MKKLTFEKDGYDYISNNRIYAIGEEYGFWRVYINEVKQAEYFDTVKSAKVWCIEHFNK